MSEPIFSKEEEDLRKELQEFTHKTSMELHRRFLEKDNRKVFQTTALVEPGNTSGVLPEFGRTIDVQRLFGIKRGTLYTLSRQGKVKSCLLRVAGQKSGVRLWHLQSIRDFIHSQMEGGGDAL